MGKDFIPFAVHNDLAVDHKNDLMHYCAHIITKKMITPPYPAWVFDHDNRQKG